MYSYVCAFIFSACFVDFDRKQSNICIAGLVSLKILQLCHLKRLWFSAFVSRRPSLLDTTQLWTSCVTIGAFESSLYPLSDTLSQCSLLLCDWFLFYEFALKSSATVIIWHGYITSVYDFVSIGILFIPKAGKALCDAKDAEVNRRAPENQIAELVSQTNIEEQECQAELNACNQEQWKDQCPLGYLLKEVSIDKPFEEDACCCQFNFVTAKTGSSNSDLVLKFLWFVGERTPSNFIAIPGATGEVYLPKHEDIGKILKVECIPILDGTEYPTIFAISSRVSPGMFFSVLRDDWLILNFPPKHSLQIILMLFYHKGTGWLKVLKIDVRGELIEGNTMRIMTYQGLLITYGERTPSNFIAIPEATRVVYLPKHEDIGRILKVECTPVLDGTEYPTRFAISSWVSPGTGWLKVLKIDVRGELMEGNTIRGYVEVAWCGGTPGKGVASWLWRRWNSSSVVIVGAEDEQYQLTLDDIDSCLVLMYTPVTKEGVKGEPQYAITDTVKAGMGGKTSLNFLC
ncbi:hypothetical protein RHGRI_020463 [Rhododendron griersonianum]|uniref:AIR9-like A9 domain-containing protein n=1 Tax=Rhododendron griersonianum TaxID=479676 RepID=A0AAV6JKE1_9ERIC|nr:hypothetical protein RHGRI_020463 [Rhododendron griersonianum]